MEIKEKNAQITSTMLGIEDHGIMSFMLYLNYGDGGGQGAGGWTLDDPVEKDGRFLRRVGTAEGMSLIMAILEVVGVEKWEDLKGQYIRVRQDWNKVHAIGNITKDKWLVFEQFFKDIKQYTDLLR